jgi:transposase, IS6 family
MPVAETDLFKWRHYESEIILLCMRWYLRYAVLRQNLIPTPNASHWSHITPVNMLYLVSPNY